MLAGYRYIGLPPVIIVGGSGTAAFVLLWSLTYLRRPLMPETVLPPFLLTVAALEIHMILRKSQEFRWINLFRSLGESRKFVCSKRSSAAPKSVNPR
jgi:hypothetical protein